MVLDRKAAVSKIQQDKRVEALRKKRFASLIATPFSMGSIGINNPSPNGLDLPDAGVIGVSFSVPVSQGQVIITSSTGRSLGTPNLAANQVWRIGFFEKAVELSAQAAIAGVIKFHYLDDNRKPFQISTGTFT